MDSATDEHGSNTDGKALTVQVCENLCQSVAACKAAITFNSIAIGVGNAVTSIVVRVGFGLSAPAKYSAYSLLYVGKSFFMFVRKTITSTISFQVALESSSTSRTFSNTARHW